MKTNIYKILFNQKSNFDSDYHPIFKVGIQEHHFGKSKKIYVLFDDNDIILKESDVFFLDDEMGEERAKERCYQMMVMNLVRHINNFEGKIIKKRKFIFPTSE